MYFEQIHKHSTRVGYMCFSEHHAGHATLRIRNLVVCLLKVDMHSVVASSEGRKYEKLSVSLEGFEKIERNICFDFNSFANGLAKVF